MHWWLTPPRSPRQWRAWWRGRGGYRDVLALAGPLCLSTGALSIQHFVDRMFLTWHSPAAMAAALPAGMIAFTLLAPFIGTASYTNTFVAQYHGAGRPERIGPAVWQAVWFSAAAGAAVLGVVPLAEPLFRWAGHDPPLVPLETRYLQIMCLGGGLAIYSSALSGYFTGLGRTWTVMWVNLGVTAVNIALDYVWIFGRCGFPEGGIAGAAWATVAATAVGAAVLTALFLAPAPRRVHATAHPTLERDLLARLLRFGVPSGMQLLLDTLCFSLFVLFLGRMGTLELGASNVAVQINLLAFLPMIGLGIAVSTLVGQALGEERPELAARATWAALHLGALYSALMAVLFVIAPRWFIAPFAAHSDPAGFEPMSRLAVVLLRFVAFYCVFDTMNIVFAAALKGAGDTRFVMTAALALGVALMVAPAWWASTLNQGGVLAAWTGLTLYVLAAGTTFLVRFLQGRWARMRVIEPLRPAAGPVLIVSDAPAAQADVER